MSHKISLFEEELQYIWKENGCVFDRINLVRDNDCVFEKLCKIM